MSENNIKPTSSSSTAQVNTQLQNETSKPLDGASCSASSFVTTRFAEKIQNNLKEILRDLDFSSVNAQHAKKCSGVTHAHFPCDEQTGENLRKTLLNILNDYQIPSDYYVIPR